MYYNKIAMGTHPERLSIGMLICLKNRSAAFNENQIPQIQDA
ncbi:hypothetical protein [Chryseosolibacter indicus]|nr:hypothetical protein [Chryseosolibacter indicus]